ncbi:MAG: FAD-dependent oxidoreductase, partial [Armatimonadetes bacterium]|nr:FAD-dependent oxidoreductase [Armatimonadota bacterium]
MDAEVLIIGAGPAGSAAALHLARRGRDVLLVDRCRFPRPKPCGEYYNPEAVRLLGELGVLPAMQAAGAARITSLAVGAGGEDPTGKGAALGPAAPFPVGIA